MAGRQGGTGGGGGFYNNRGRGGNNNGRGGNNNRRKRGGNQGQQGQQHGPKYTQANGFQEDAEFQAKLPSDTAPAFRFVERRGKRGKGGGAGNAGPGGHQNHHHHGQGGRHHTAKDTPQQFKVHNAPPATAKPAAGRASGLQENITPKTLRIVSAPSKPEASDDSAQANTSFSGSSLIVETSSPQEVKSTLPILPEPVEARSKPQLEPGQDNATDLASNNDEDEGGVPISWAMAADAQSVTPAASTAENLATEEPMKIPIRELLDTSDFIEPMTMSKPPFLPAIPDEAATPSHNQPAGIFSSPLTITKTPYNPNDPANAAQDPTPLERFLKLSDVTSRYLTERLGDINYSPDLSRRLKSDFEVIEAAYNAIPFERALNAHRILWHTLLSLKKAVELRNNDAKIVGALKKMTQTYDTVRHQALHERRFDGEQPFGTEAGAPTAAATAAAGKWDSNSGFQAIARSGENLMDTLKWNIRGGDTNVRLSQGNGNAGRTAMGFGNPGFGGPGFDTNGFSTANFVPPRVETPSSGYPSFRSPWFKRNHNQTPWGAGVSTPTKSTAGPDFGIIGGHLK
ncbi:hypothetical protein TWF481_011719 [Arthrobotrys musiformis]|uniref:Uncharacterized protein n=1 Tax=Arthrobotrys musiformis TaxID=47236 RepID=A0AAV9VZ90_9PEZI